MNPEPDTIDVEVDPDKAIRDREIREAEDTERRTGLLMQRFESNLVDEIQKLEAAQEIVKRRAALLTTMRHAGIGDTDPQGWVLHKAQDGSIVGIPGSAACTRLAKLYGIAVTRMRPLDDEGNFNPEEIPVKDGEEIEFRGFCDGRSAVTGEVIEQVEFSRRTDEQFIGRYDDMAARLGPWIGDIRKSVGTGLRSKTVRILTGTGKVPYDQLKIAFEATSKNVDDCTQGHGFGTSGARGARKVAEPEVAGTDDKPGTAEQLWNEIVKRTGGDLDDARKVLKDITSKEKTGTSKGFPGFDDWHRLTQSWQVKNATAALATHPDFGDPD